MNSSKIKYGPVVYTHISDMIKNEISEGIYQKGEKLPSIRNMANKLQVCPSTIQRTYSLLEREDFIYRCSTYGYFVSEKYESGRE